MKKRPITNDSPGAVERVGSGVFTECRETCPFHRETNTAGGGWSDDCAHPENSPHLPTDQTPCEPCVCPIFTSDDEKGDNDHCRYPHEIEGRWQLQNNQLVASAADGDEGRVLRRTPRKNSP